MSSAILQDNHTESIIDDLLKEPDLQPLAKGLKGLYSVLKFIGCGILGSIGLSLLGLTLAHLPPFGGMTLLMLLMQIPLVLVTFNCVLGCFNGYKEVKEFI